MKVTRRVFVSIAGGCAGVLGVWGAKGLLETYNTPASRPDASWRALSESWVPSICRACPAGCGIRGRLIDGNLVKIEGNPLHPVSRGGLCARGLAGLQLAYDPDRPMTSGIRASQLGEARPRQDLAPSDALKILADRIQAAVRTRGPEGLAIVDGTGPSGSAMLLRGLARGLGMEGTWPHDPDAGLRLAMLQTQGGSMRPAYDIANAETVFAFGAGFLEDDASPVRRALDMADLRGHAEERRRTLIVVEPRFSMSASRADRWVPIRPGTYGALALAIAYVVLKENRYPAALLRELSEGIEDRTLPDGTAVAGFRRLVMEQGRPDKAAAITGIPQEVILEIGKLFATSRRALAIPTREVTQHGGGVRNAALIHTLNVLVGGLDIPGGVLTPCSVPVTPDPDVPADSALAANSEDNAEGRLLDIALGRRPPPDVLILAEAEPEEWPGGTKAWREVRERVPFIATFAARPGPSVEASDLVLPSASYLESWDLWFGPSPIGTAVLGVARPILAPAEGIRSTGDWILALANLLGGPARRALPWKDSEEHVRFRLEGLHQAKRGTPFSSDIDEQHLQNLEARGWWSSPHAGLKGFLDETIKRGGWSDPFYRHRQYGRVLRTPTGRFRLPDEITPASAPDTLDLAVAEAGPAVHLHPFPIVAFTGSGGSELPWLQQNVDVYGRLSWRPWIELNPLTAEQLGIENDQEVVVENRRGRAVAVAKLFEGAMPGLLNLPVGFSPHSAGRYARNRGDDIFQLLGSDRDPVSGFISLSSTPVRVSPA